MVIKDIKGFYVINVDTKKRVVSEAQKGTWNEEVFARFDKEFDKIFPLFKGKKWAKLSDISEYNPSQAVSNLLPAHIQKCAEAGLTSAAVAVGASALKQMQMVKGDGGLVSPKFVATSAEGLTFLESLGYK